MSNRANDDYYRMLKELQTVDFVLVELSLYLDTHPRDPQAVQQINHFTQIRHGLAHEFETKFGPLLQFGRSGYTNFPWQWADAPWPWQV